MNGITAGAAALMGAGALFLWSGFHGASVTGSLRDLLAGKQPPGTDTNPITGAGAGGPGGGGTVAASGSNQQTGQQLAAGYGWNSGAQWDALVRLWDRESNWSNTAENPSSGAYGIPQALPYSKMPRAAWPPAAGGQADPVAQILWGLQYIAQRYGDPVSAWAHEQTAGWY